mgnify:CR=1 FL=1
MAKWIRPLEDVASGYARARKTSRSLEDEEVVRALMEKAGIEEKKKKPSFLQRLSGALSALEWSDDLLKTMKQGGNVGDFAKSYLTDIPKTIYGALAGDYEALEPNEGRGVELMEYLINTYTKENDTILDFAMGSGSTGVACVNLNRNFIGIELDEGYFNIAKERIENISKIA